jgi:hypothetical protein
MDREELLRKLRDLAQELGKETLTQKDIRASEISTYWIGKHFRNLASALEAAGLQPSKLAKSMATSNDELLDYLDDLQRRLGRRPTYLDIDREGRFSQAIFSSRFGSLDNALSQLKERGVPVEERPRMQPRSREELVRKLQEIAQQHGDKPLREKDIRAYGLSPYWIRKHFRNLASALEAAGLQPSKLARSMATSDEELLDYLDDLQRRLGQRPTYLDIDREGRFSQRIFTKRFGSLRNALSQLKERQIPVEEHLGAEARPERKERDTGVSSKPLVKPEISKTSPLQEDLESLREDPGRLFAKVTDFTKNPHTYRDSPRWTRLDKQLPDITPEDFLQYAKCDLESDLAHRHVNALSNVKRALDCQLDCVRQALLGEKEISRRRKKAWGSLPRKVEALQTAGILAPPVLKKINHVRNVLEHEFQRPTPECF